MADEKKFVLRGLLQAVSEVILMLLGGLLLFLAVAGMFSVDRRSGQWIGLAILLVYLGVKSLHGARQGAGRYFPRWEQYVRGGSLVVVGAIMLAAAILPASYLGHLMAGAGAILTLRGFANTALALRPR